MFCLRLFIKEKLTISNFITKQSTQLMKMKNVFTLKTLAIVLAGVAGLGSCSKNTDPVLSTDDSQSVNTESLADTHINETSDMASVTVGSLTNTTYGTGARVDGTPIDITSKVTDPRLAGATITLTINSGSTRDYPSGTITIDFKSGVTTNGVTRKGQIIITYNGRKDMGQSTRVLGYNGYSRNGVLFDNAMTFTHTNMAAQGAMDSTHFHHVLSSGKLTFPDNTTIVRATDFDVTLAYDNTTKKITTLTLSAHSGATHSATGINRKGKDYTMDITKPIVYMADCAKQGIFLAASGSKTITAGLITYTIDYGTGTCDNTLTITVGGKTITITASADGN
jgi:hypothetical protein